MMGNLFLIIDDDVDDVELFCEALAEINENLYCVYAYNADYAWNYLKNTPENLLIFFSIFIFP